MDSTVLVKLFEHNLWANQQILQACAGLTDKQLDARPRSVTKGTIRRTLVHLVHSQSHYLDILTLPLEERHKDSVDFSGLEESQRLSGEGLIALARDTGGSFPKRPLQTKDGYNVEPWVLMLQALNHASEHREQIKSMLSDLGITPPAIDGWDYGQSSGAMVKIGK